MRRTRIPSAERCQGDFPSALYSSLRPLRTRLDSAKSAGIRQSNVHWPIGTGRRRRAVKFLSFDWEEDMRSGSIRAVAGLALVSFGILGSSNSGAVRPEAVSDGGSLVTPVWTPLGVSKAPVTVVVQVAGDSVAEQQANAGRKLDREDRKSTRLNSSHMSSRMPSSA